MGRTKAPVQAPEGDDFPRTYKRTKKDTKKPREVPSQKQVNQRLEEFKNGYDSVVCLKCGSILVDNGGFTSHKGSYHSRDLFKCQVKKCGLSFAKYSSLQTHYSQKHKTKRAPPKPPTSIKDDEYELLSSFLRKLRDKDGKYYKTFEQLRVRFPELLTVEEPAEFKLRKRQPTNKKIGTQVVVTRPDPDLVASSSSSRPEEANLPSDDSISQNDVSHSPIHPSSSPADGPSSTLDATVAETRKPGRKLKHFRSSGRNGGFCKVKQVLRERLSKANDKCKKLERKVKELRLQLKQTRAASVPTGDRNSDIVQQPSQVKLAKSQDVSTSTVDLELDHPATQSSFEVENLRLELCKKDDIVRDLKNDLKEMEKVISDTKELLLPYEFETHLLNPKYHGKYGKGLYDLLLADAKQTNFFKARAAELRKRVEELERLEFVLKRIFKKLQDSFKPPPKHPACLGKFLDKLKDDPDANAERIIDFKSSMWEASLGYLSVVSNSQLSSLRMDLSCLKKGMLDGDAAVTQALNEFNDKGRQRLGPVSRSLMQSVTNVTIPSTDELCKDENGRRLIPLIIDGPNVCRSYSKDEMHDAAGVYKRGGPPPLNFTHLLEFIKRELKKRFWSIFIIVFPRQDILDENGKLVHRDPDLIELIKMDFDESCPVWIEFGPRGKLDDNFALTYALLTRGCVMSNDLYKKETKIQETLKEPAAGLFYGLIDCEGPYPFNDGKFQILEWIQKRRMQFENFRGFIILAADQTGRNPEYTLFDLVSRRNHVYNEYDDDDDY